MKKIGVSGFLSIVFAITLVLAPFVVEASETDGTVDPTYKYAWGENVGWVNFGCDNCSVHVTDSGLSGYALSETAGWINLDAVANDGEGNLSGYAWSENTGYIKFDPTNGGVHINSSGEFTGSALSENVGWIIFSGDNKVKTDWRPASSRVSTEVAPVSSGGSSGSASGRRNIAAASSAQSGFLTEANSVLQSITQKAEAILNVFAFLKSENEPSGEIVTPNIAAEKPSEALSKNWSLLSSDPINQFLFASLPAEIKNLVSKFPELGKTFREVGINKISDLEKLKNAKFNLAGLNTKVGLAGGVRVPIASLTATQKSLVPSDVVFARVGDLIDYDIQLSINENGAPEQTITTIVGKPLDLAVKTDKPAESVKGYIVVKNIERQQAKAIPADSMMAAPIFAVLGTKHTDDENIAVEEKLVVSRFDYRDDDKDGIYTASIASPLVSGEYEIISIIDYKDPNLGKKELRLVTIVDPEGYIYQKYSSKEIRIPDAKVILYFKNSEGSFETWKAENYQQVNPQKTDKSGSYSFLVPEGIYKLSVSSDEYYVFESSEFEVAEGRGVHMNIEMKQKSWWRSLLNLFKQFKNLK